MIKLSEVTANASGAKFYRADLHVHAVGGSHDVKDKTMTPKAVVATALKEGLGLIAIADHNEIVNVKDALEAAIGTGLVVIPAVELSTPQGHLLCYLPTLQALEQFHARLNIADRGTQTSHCQNSMFECLEQLEPLNGFGVLAHVDAGAGFETVMPGGLTPHRTNIICHPALLGIELKSVSSDIAYSDTDPVAHRAALGARRIEKLGLGSRQFLARLLNSDAHTLKALGRNANGDRKVSRLKMERPSFDGLRIALEDSDARVRIEDAIPDQIPQVLGIAAEGGFLNGLRIHFGPNLNCIIGGRGTGKSTTFEAIKCLIAGIDADDVVDSDIWPDHLHLFWQDQAGEQHSLYRPANGDLVNLDDPSLGPTNFQIESYGQGETARISSDAQKSPVALLDYLDRFVDLRVFMAEEEEARDQLLATHEKIEAAKKKVERIPILQQELTTTQKQLAALEKANAKEVIELQRYLEDERALRDGISEKLGEMAENLEAFDPEAEVEELILLAKPEVLRVGSTEYSGIIAGGRSFQAVAKSAKSNTAREFIVFQKLTEKELKNWKAKEAAAVQQIDGKKKQLEAQGIRLDLTYIQKLTRDEARQKSELSGLSKWPDELTKLTKAYKTAATARWIARGRVAANRVAYARQASDVLKAVLSDLSVSLKFLESAYSPDAEAQIIQAMGWRTTNVPRAALLIEKLSLSGLIKAIDKKDGQAIVGVKTNEGASVFTLGDANRIIAALSDRQVRFAIERAQVFDVPRLTVTAVVEKPGGGKQVLQRDFSKLSLGQQQSVLLALMLSSTSTAPLIIDQPEDNLDSEFIYKTLVPVLRRAKERRQIIIVTHNPNIAVLGDAEQIIVFKSASQKGSVVGRGSIDDGPTRVLVCDVLEGAKEAFKRRAKIYGVA